MKYMAKIYQTEEDLLKDARLDTETSVITGVEFNPTERTIIYTIRTLNETEITGEVSKGLVRRVRLDR